VWRCRRAARQRCEYRNRFRFSVFTLIICTLALTADGRPTTTTIYVGRYFEVRDLDAPVKYVFNGGTRVARITGSLSANVRIQRLRLFRGWNLVSPAVSADDFVGQFERDVVGVAKVIYQWNGSTKSYSSLAAGQGVAAGAALWVDAVTNAIMAVDGAFQPSSSLTVPAGGTYIAGPAMEAWTPGLPPGWSEWAFITQSNVWVHNIGGEFAFLSDPPWTLVVGQAAYVQAAVPGSLQLPDPALSVRYYHEDHLGSSSVMSDANGVPVGESAYYPFGLPRNRYAAHPSGDPYQFTQKERDDESGLEHFEARYLAPGLSRFLSVDPLTTPESRTAYAYAANNPMKFVDPAGLDPTWKVGGEATQSGDVLTGPISAEASGSFSDESISTTPWILPTVKYKNDITIGGGLRLDTTSLEDIIHQGGVSLRGQAHGRFTYSPDAPDPNWVLNVPFDISTRGGLGLNGLSYSGTASARYGLGQLPLGKVSVSFEGSGLSVPEYSWRQYGIGFYPKIDPGVLPVPRPEQVFEPTKMEWGQGIGPNARYVKQWATSRLELVGGLGIGLNNQNVPQFTGIFARLSYTWGQPRSWSRMPTEMSENAGLPQ
jgi:RHS repeat-associated protein